MDIPTMTGQRHWQAPDQLSIKREKGWAYRYIKKADVERRLDEGWEIVASPLKQHKEGGAVDRAQHYRGLILMRLPQEMADQRNAHYRELHNRRLRAVARGAHMTSVSRAATSSGMTGEDGRALAGTIGAGLVVHQGVVTNEGLTHTDNLNIPLTAHPDDLREDVQVVKEMEAEAKPPEDGEEEAEKKTARSKAKPVKRR